MASKKQNANDQSILGRSSLAQILAVSVKNLVLMSYGMSLGFPTLLIPILSEKNNGEPFFLEADGLSWIGSIVMICVPLGAVASGIVTQSLGRKRSMQLVNIPFCVAWLFYYFSSQIWHIFAALIMSGMAGGLMEAPVLTYIAEICQPHLRGMLASTSPMSVIVGIMIQFILGTFLKWRSVALCCGVMPIISFNLLFLIPETPIWLLSKERYAEAKRSIAWLRGWVSDEDITEEYRLLRFMKTKKGETNRKQMDEISIENDQLEKLTLMKTLKLLKNRNCMRPYILVTYTCFLSHFCGISAVQTYAVKIFTVLRAPLDGYFATALIGIVEMLGCIICVSMVRYVGKRVLTFISLNGTAVCFIVLGIHTHSFHLNTLINSEDTEIMFSNFTTSSETSLSNSAEFSWVPVITIILAAFLSHVGIRILPWILISEVFSNDTKAILCGMSAANFYVLGFLCNKMFLSMVSKLTLPGTFWFFSSMSLIGFIVLYFMLPETEGKSLAEITDHFSGKSKLGNSVQENNKKEFEADEASGKLYYEYNAH